MATAILTFKNQPILRLFDDSRPHKKIQFGLFRAKLIINNLEAIKQFIEDNPKIEPPDS